MFQCRERQRGCANTNIGWQTLCGSRQTWDLLPPATKVENTKWWWWYKYKTPTQRHRNGQHWAPLLTRWSAANTKTKIWSSFVAFFISSLLILPFQVTCTYVLLSSIHVNVFRFACGMQLLFFNLLPWSHLRYSDRLQTPNPGTRWGCKLVRHLPTTGISVLPYLGISKPRKTPNLNRFYKRKRKNWVHLIKKLKWYVWQLVNLNQGSFIFKKNYDFQKKIHTFSLFIKKLPLSLNLTQFYIPSHNSNLKMNLYEKLHFLCSILTFRTTVRL